MKADPSRRIMKVSMAANSAEEGGLELDSDAHYHVFEFWSQRYLGRLSSEGDLSVELRPGETAMINLQQVVDHPQVIGSNRHFMQGMYELDDVRWSESENSLSGTLDIVADDPVVITVARNGVMGHAELLAEDADIEIHEVSDDMLQLQFSSSESRTISWALSFK